MTLIKSINPYIGEILSEFHSLSEKEIEEKLSAASVAFSNWKDTDFTKRAELMEKAAKVLKNRREKYAKIISQEMGKVIKESLAEVDKCALVCEYYAENGAKFLEEEPISLPEGKKAKIIHQPLGTILASLPLCRSYSDGGKCRRLKTRFKRTSMLISNRRGIYRSRFSNWSFSKFIN